MISYDKRTRPVLIFSKNYYYNSSSTPSLSHAGYKSKRPNEVFIPHPLRRVFKRFKNGSHTLLSGSHKKKTRFCFDDYRLSRIRTKATVLRPTYTLSSASAACKSRSIVP